ncbi:MAG: TetR/AcrR family transcriptional regulator [Solobacterium sp.]|nr:TetR/AcrR family transcriptional regulator [Solobacterium sp.]
MKEKIIDAAIKEFKQKGLKFTMSDVAKRLSISKKTIYTVFESKQALLYAIADSYAADFESMQEELENDNSLNELQKLQKLLCALPEKYCDIGLNRIYELSRKYPGPYRHLMASVNNGWKLAEEYLRKGLEENRIKEISVPVAMAMVKGTVHSFMETDILYHNGITYKQGKNEIVKILMKGIQK